MDTFTAKYYRLKLFLFIGAVLLGLICSSNAALTGPTIAIAVGVSAKPTTTAAAVPTASPTKKKTTTVSTTVNPTATPTVSAKPTFASTAKPTKAPVVSPTFQPTITHKPTAPTFAPSRPPCNISSGLKPFLNTDKYSDILIWIHLLQSIIVLNFFFLSEQSFWA